MTGGSQDPTPSSAPEPSVTQLLQEGVAGKSESRDRLFGLIYGELRRIATREIRGEAKDHTLQATALVNEAYLRLFRKADRTWESRDHFLGFAARAMRSILVDHARAKRREKRDPGGERVPMDGVLLAFEERGEDLVLLDDALEKLAQVDPRMVQLVELRFFGGRSMEEAARILGLSLRTAEREWQTARAWLRREVLD